MKNPTVMIPEPHRAEIVDAEMPALKDDQVLIESEVTLVSIGTEMTCYIGGEGLGEVWSRGRRYPYWPGYSNVGVVRETGAGVDGDLVGTRVQSYGRHGKFVAVRDTLARPVHRDIPSDHAVFATMAEIAFNGVRRSGVAMGKSVVVYGLGLLGQLSVRFARLCGARPALAVDLADTRLDLLPDDPAVVRVNPQRDDVAAAVREATRSRMADVVIELTGVQSLIPVQIPLLRRQGTLGIVSGPRGVTEMDFHDLVVASSIHIVGVHNGSHTVHPNAADPWTKARDVELFIDLVADGDMDVARMISFKKPYAEAPEVYAMLEEDRTRVMGALFNWTAVP